MAGKSLEKLSKVKLKANNDALGLTLYKDANQYLKRAEKETRSLLDGMYRDFSFDANERFIDQIGGLIQRIKELLSIDTFTGWFKGKAREEGRRIIMKNDRDFSNSFPTSRTELKHVKVLF